MQFEGDRKALLEAMKAVGKVVMRKTTRPILQCVHINANDTVTLRASDMETTLSVTVEKVDVKTPGAAVCPAYKLTEILSKLPDEKVLISYEDGKVIVATDRGSFKILTDKPGDYPAAPETDWDGALKIKLADLQAQIAKTMFAAATERTRYALNGLYLKREAKKILLVGTDGKRLAKAILALNKCKAGEGVIVPLKAFAVMLSMPTGDRDEVEIVIGEKKIAARTMWAEMTCKTVEGYYPDYDVVIPKENENILKIATADFKQAVTEGALLGDRESHAVRFKFSDDGLVLSSRSPDLGEAKITLDVDYTGKDLEMGFNPDYLLDVCPVLGEEITMALGSETGAALITDGSGYQYVVMPVALG